jgi:hypothetical protein
MPRPPVIATEEPPFRGLGPALLLASVVLGASAIGVYAPPAQGEVGVVFPIGTDAREAYARVLASGGRFVGPSHFDNVVVAYATDGGFADRVREAGALFLMAAHGLCTDRTTQEI